MQGAQAESFSTTPSASPRGERVRLAKGICALLGEWGLALWLFKDGRAKVRIVPDVVRAIVRTVKRATRGVNPIVLKNPRTGLWDVISAPTIPIAASAWRSCLCVGAPIRRAYRCSAYCLVPCIRHIPCHAPVWLIIWRIM